MVMVEVVVVAGKQREGGTESLRTDTRVKFGPSFTEWNAKACSQVALSSYFKDTSVAPCPPNSGDIFIFIFYRTIYLHQVIYNSKLKLLLDRREMFRSNLQNVLFYLIENKCINQYLSNNSC